jgi:hypothetical protein
MTKVACAFKKNKNKLQRIDFQYDNYKFKSNKKSEVQLIYIHHRYEFGNYFSRSTT